MFQIIDHSPICSTYCSAYIMETLNICINGHFWRACADDWRFTLTKARHAQSTPMSSRHHYYKQHLSPHPHQDTTKVWLHICSDSYWVNFLRFVVSQFVTNVKHCLIFEYHVYIQQVSLQLGCGETRQIWVWPKEFSGYFLKSEFFPRKGINERSFSKPHPRADNERLINQSAAILCGWCTPLLSTSQELYTWFALCCIL